MTTAQLQAFTQATSQYNAQPDHAGACYLLTIDQLTHDLPHPTGSWRVTGFDNAGAQLGTDNRCSWSGGVYPTGDVVELGPTAKVLAIPDARLVAVGRTGWTFMYLEWPTTKPSIAATQLALDDVLSNVRQVTSTTPPPGYPTASTRFQGDGQVS